MSHHDQHFVRTPASLVIAPKKQTAQLLKAEPSVDGETKVIVKGQGVLCVQSPNEEPFAFLIQDDNKKNSFKLSVEQGKVAFSEQKSGLWESIDSRQAFVEDSSGIDPDSHCIYWFSVDSHNCILRYGKGEVRKNTVLAELNFPKPPEKYNAKENNPPYPYRWVSKITAIYHEPIKAATPVKIYRDPVIVDPAMVVVDSSAITMEQVAANSATVAANLTKTCQQLYATVSGANFVLDTPDFPDFSEAIEASIANPEGWCYKTLANKATEFGGKPNPEETYLRITMGLNQGDSPGIPYVMEIWPPAHYSPVHNHGGANAIIRVLHGEITVKLFPMLSDFHRVPFMERKFLKDDVTWISPELNQTHQLHNANFSGPTCITIQCYMYGEGDKTHYDYFDYIGETGQIEQFTPNSDMDFLRFKETMRAEWNK